MALASDLQRRLLSLLAGKWVASAISAAAELGLADALASGPLDAGGLGRQLGCEPPRLLRLLRVLGAEGVVESMPDGRFALTDLGRQLQTGQLRDLARFVGADFMWRPWAALPQALRSGGSAFGLSHGEELFDYLDGHADEARLYHDAVDAFTRVEAAALAEAFDFSSVSRVVDLGGGMGTLLLLLASRWPHLSCVLYDRPNVIDAARARFEAGSVRGPFEFVGGDFFSTPLPEADVFVIKHVLHNWGDEPAQRLLETCRRGLRPGGKVLVIEGVLLPGDIREPTRLMDLEMLVLCGEGRERTKPEFRALFARAGWRLVSTCDLAGTTRLFVAEPRSA